MAELVLPGAQPVHGGVGREVGVPAAAFVAHDAVAVIVEDAVPAVPVRGSDLGSVHQGSARPCALVVEHA